MDLTDIYRAAFQAREQHDAHNPELRARFDEFGHLKPEPTIEGFCEWGPNQYQKPSVVLVDTKSAKARNAEARLRLNRLLKIKKVAK